MLYGFLKIAGRLSIRIFCRKIRINKPGSLSTEGPLLIACNHPNSFLDAVILDILFKQPLWSLARGDAFVNKKVAEILFALNILPVYRTSEGVENLTDNYKTFQSCIDLFKKNGSVLIFSEGLCVNEWKLRPLKKGTARLAVRCREENIPLMILPVAVNYHSFRSFGKNVIINFGIPFPAAEFDASADGLYHSAFNKKLREELEPLVVNIDEKDLKKRKDVFYEKQSVIKKALLFIPALLGFFIHAPLYLPVKSFAWRKCKGTVHYDSVMAGMLIILYPLYLLLISILSAVFLKTYYPFLLMIVLPFTAWSYVQLKNQFENVSLLF